MRRLLIIGLVALLSQKAVARDEPSTGLELCASYNERANRALAQNDAVIAWGYAKKAFDIADSLGLDDAKRDASSLLSKIAMYNHQLEESMYYDSIFQAVRGSINTRNLEKLTVGIQKKYQSEKTEKENETLRQVQARQVGELSLQSYAMACIGTTLLVVVGLLLILFRSNQTVKKQNLLLHSQNHAIRQHQLEISTQKDKITLQNEKLQVALTKLRTAQDRLIHADKMASLGEMTAGIAHEINNPLNYISGSVSSLDLLVGDLINLAKTKNVMASPVAREVSSAPPLEELERDIPVLMTNISTGVKRANKIITGLLTFSRPHSDEVAMVDIHDCLDTALVLLKTKASESKIVVETRYEKSAPIVKANKVQLEQVFANIIDNAIYAVSSKPGTRKLTITTKMIDTKVRVSICDNGPGVPQEYRSKIMEPFFTTKPVGKGTGLGLSISYGIINKLGGQLAFSSEAGEGTEFVVTLNALKAL